MGKVFPFDDWATAVAPHVWYDCDTAILTELKGNLGMAAKRLSSLYYNLLRLRKRDAFFLEAWQQAGGPRLLYVYDVPDDLLPRCHFEVHHIRNARRALFALMRRSGYPYYFGHFWPYDPENEPIWRKWRG